jgi:hypothetical protein
MHVPPFWHGWDAQSMMSSAQLNPRHPSAHVQL